MAEPQPSQDAVPEQQQEQLLEAEGQQGQQQQQQQQEEEQQQQQGEMDIEALHRLGETTLQDRLPRRVLALSLLLERRDEELVQLVREDSEGAAAAAMAADGQQPTLTRQSSAVHAQHLPWSLFPPDEETEAALVDRLPSSSAVSEYRSLRLELTETYSVLDGISTWSRMMLPRMRDGDQFAQDVQILCAEDAEYVQTLIEGFRIEFVDFIGFRAYAISKIVKYPQVSDYREYLKRLDAQIARRIRTQISDARNSLIVLYDTIQRKNRETIDANEESSAGPDAYAPMAI